MRLFIATVLCCGPAFSQQTRLPISADEINATFAQIAQRAARIEPMLGQLRPNDWIAKGAPDTYAAQLNSTIEQLRAIRIDMAALAQHTGAASITDSMKALFRVQTTQETLTSLMGGARRYQNPALADLIEAVAAEASGDIEQVERYLLEQADEKEKQFGVVDKEAQSCRAALSRQPATAAQGNRKAQ